MAEIRVSEIEILTVITVLLILSLHYSTNNSVYGRGMGHKCALIYPVSFERDALGTVGLVLTAKMP